MKEIRVTCIALGAFAFAASCSKEAAEPNVYDWESARIHIKPSISNAFDTRAEEMTLDRLESFQVTCFNTVGTSAISDGYLSPYFENATFIRKPNSSFESSPDEEDRNWPSNSGRLQFFAFSPSITEIGDNHTSLEGSNTQYRLRNVRINPDISRQFDFVTAEASGERWKDFSSGVDLAFAHRLCQVELKAWGGGTNHCFEIAGVRIGNTATTGTFVFADDEASEQYPGWDPDGISNGNVEYLYRSVTSTYTEDMPESGDRIFRINPEEHSTSDSAASLMGSGGCAMVIPTINSAWEGTADPNTSTLPYTTERMYFSILMRVTDPNTGSVIYPYPGNPSGMAVVSYALDEEGNILSRLYSGETPGEYYSDAKLQHPYEVGEGEDIRDFGWAAVPVDADWSAGRKYVYTLNYSEGIGLHDPSDPEPGKPIGGQSSIKWGVSVSGWNYAEKDENYDPDLNVP